MKELFQFPFRYTKLKCGVIWAFMVTSAPGPRREHNLGSAACRVPCKELLRGARQAVVSPHGYSFLSCWGRFVELARCSCRGLGDSTRNMNTNRKTREIQGSENVQHLYLFYNCFVFFMNPASTLFFIDTKQMYFFLFRSKLLWHCILQL